MPNPKKQLKKVKGKNPKPIFPQRGKIVLLLKDNMVIAGDGYIEGVKLTTGEYRFTGTLVKNYDKK